MSITVTKTSVLTDHVTSVWTAITYPATRIALAAHQSVLIVRTTFTANNALLVNMETNVTALVEASVLHVKHMTNAMNALWVGMGHTVI